MWMYFLLSLFAHALLAASENATTNKPWPSVESSSSSSTKSIEGTSAPSRRGYERDVLVVLPVMQGNSDLTNSNLQMLYTKTPVTAIINEQPEIRSSSDGKRSTAAMKMTTTSTIAPVSTSTPAHPTLPVTVKHSAQTMSAAPHIKRDDSRHPYTDFLHTKSTPKAHKSPLDYGYPESFKFVQELNELPKNHKPEWAQSELAEAESKKSTTTEGSTKGNPFQMFESVKPLEINKLLSLKTVAIPVTDSIFEETATKKKQESAEIPNRATKRPFNKRPNKKPQKVKLNPQKLSDIELAPFIPFMMTSTDKASTDFDLPSTTKEASSSPSTTAAIATSTQTIQQPTTTKSEGELYDTVRYSTLFAQSSKVFLPTPYMSSDRVVIRPIKSSTPGQPSSESWSPMTSPSTTTTSTTTARSTSTSTTTTAAPTTSIPTSTTQSSSINWANVNAIIGPIMETTTLKIAPEVQPSDLISLSKILDEHFDKKAIQEILPTTTTVKPHFPAEMLTNDMKNMLIALGLLKPEPGSLSPLLLVTSTPAPSSTDPQPWDSLFIKREPVTPTIDPDSYTNFKKLPIDQEKPQVSNDMRDLLSSFGLLPSAKSSQLATNSILTRISRQHKQQTADHSMDMLDDKMRETLENLGLMKPMAYQLNRKGHVFQPSAHLEKLADAQQKEKINSALATIRMLSKSKDVQNLPIEELEQRLRNATASLRDENFSDGNVTDKPQPTTQLFSTSKNAISHTTRTTVVQPENGTAGDRTATNSTTPLTIIRSTQTTSSDTSSTTSSTTISFFRRRNNSSASSTSSTTINSRKRGSTRFTTSASSPSADVTTSTATSTTSTTTSITSTPPSTVISTVGTTKSAENSTIFTTPSTTPSKTPSTTTSTTPSKTPSSTTTSTTFKTPSTTTSTTPSTSIFTKTVATSADPESTTKSIEIVITGATNGASPNTVTPTTISLFPEEHNEVNYTPDASSVSLVKLSHAKNSTKVVMAPPPNPLSIEELQYLLESNRNDVKRQQPQDTSTASTTNSIQNISTTESDSVGDSSKTSNDSITDSTSSESSSASSTTGSNGDTYANSITEDSIKDDDSSNNAPLEALADSFGGENEEQVDSWQANAKPNGLYFLLDWNTFLSVGEEDKRPIRIRFSPRAGNPRNFMPIKVP